MLIGRRGLNLSGGWGAHCERKMYEKKWNQFYSSVFRRKSIRQFFENSRENPIWATMRFRRAIEMQF
jgi:hypothetical protein